MVLQHCASGGLALPRCCTVAHSRENRPQMVFPALCSCTALENRAATGVATVSSCIYSMPVH